MGGRGEADFTNMEKYTSHEVTGEGGKTSGGGCYMKNTTGFILFFLALILAAGVGIIVHFVENRQILCELNPDQKAEISALKSDNSNLQLTGACKKLATDGNSAICKLCPAPASSQPQTVKAATKSPVTGNPRTTPYYQRQIDNVRLPRTLTPMQYDLELQPNLYGSDPETFNFVGFVRIKLQCVEKTNKITLHSNMLLIDVNSIVIVSDDGSVPNPKYTDLTTDAARQFAIIALDNDLVSGKSYTLEMRFSGPLKTDLKGLYLSSYQEAGTTKYLATTQFQPTDARKAFPCFDEPDMKAVFNITLIRKRDWTSLSNTDLVSSKDRDNDMVADSYDLTPKMSTYLVAFVVSQFTNRANTTSSNIQERAWARPESYSETEVALDAGVKILSFYEDLFGIKFPLKKQDMIAIPDYPLGAMENWGLVTYRETALLYQPSVSTESNKQRIVTVVAHEFSHQWFGNLVTMRWWDDLWLNEGFATYMEYVGTDHVHPEWNIFDQFTIAELFGAFEFDGLKSSHPVYVPVNNPDEIGEIFDKISYAKGGSLIRMMKWFLGEDTFNKGLTDYLTKLSYQNAFHDDLWNTLQERSVQDGKQLPFTVKEIMDTWINQMNYPVVMVTRTPTGLHVSQSRFLINKDSTDKEKYPPCCNYTWKIPFSYTSSKNIKRNAVENIIWFDTANKDIPDSTLPDTSDSWVLGNVQQYGFYRVNYDNQNWKSLIQQLKNDHEKISVINRAQIINDVWNLGKAGETDMGNAFEAVEYLNAEMNHVPWVAAAGELGYMDDMLVKTVYYDDFKEFMRMKVEEPYTKILEKQDPTHLDILLKSQLTRIACSYGVSKCVTEAQTLYNSWMENPNNRVDPNIKGPVYCTGIGSGGKDEWNFAYNQYKQTQVASEKAILLTALGCTREIGLLNHYLQLTLDANEIRIQDIVAVISSVGSNIIGRPLAWQFIKEHWSFLRQTLGGGFFSFSNLIKGVTQSFNEQYDLQELKQFVEDHADLGTGERAFNQAIEKTETNIKWMNNNIELIKSWLQKVVSPTKATKDVRLPRSVLPQHYDLELKPDIYSNDPATFRSYGRIGIRLHCSSNANNITMHLRQLDIDQSTIQLKNGDGSVASQRVKGLQFDADREFVIFMVDSDLQSGSDYYLSFDFSGPLKEDLHGFYVSRYTRGGEVMYMATSDFEPNDARKAFPCFDEPDIKATYSITVLRKSNKISLSNMPKREEQARPGGYIADVYEETRKMSTYLVAFIVCDFDKVTTTTKHNKKDSIWARTDYINQTALALNASSNILTFFEDYFDIPYPLPKQDLIAIPDFSAGAMENWGLITYDETYLLYQEGVSSADDAEQVVSTVVHEMSHQWFGDLVTMEWWDDLWLNEGFANFMQYFGTDYLYPDWKMFELFTVANLHKAFAADGLLTSHPIYVPVNSPGEIGEIFDSISYSKGGSVIRMMKQFLGDSTFQKGLHEYLHSKEYGNAFHDDLWFSLGNQSKTDGGNINVKDVMDTWTLQMNYPVVMVTQGENGKIIIKQKRFLMNPNGTDPGKYKSNFGYVWKIPLTFTTSKEKSFDNPIVHWMETVNGEIQHHSQETYDWVIANVQQFGFYRVNYDSGNWKNLINQLKEDHKVIHVINRGQIINDAWALAGAEEIEIDTALDTLLYLKSETEYTPWLAANKELVYVDYMLSRTALYGMYQKFLQNLIADPLQRIGMDNTGADHMQSLVRSIIVSIACRFSERTCVDTSVNLFKRWMDNPSVNPIDPNLKDSIYCTAIREGDEEQWNFAYSQYKSASVAAEKQRLLQALACTRKTWILSKYLDLTLNTTEIQLQDFSLVVNSVSSNPVGRDLVWNFVRANWNEFGKILGYRDGVFIYARSLMGGIFNSFNTEYDLQQMEDFHKENKDLSNASQNFQQALERTQQNIKWMDRNYNALEKWLKKSMSEPSNNVKDVRLPSSLSPNLYTIEIFPDFYGGDPEKFEFSGHVEIELECKSVTSNITLHAHKLEIDKQSVKVKSIDGSEIQVTGIAYDTVRQFVIVNLDSELKAGNVYYIEMNFKGPLKNDLAGLYLSSYKDGNKTIYMATTQFEPTDARKAFPCFDEPEIKSRFNISLIRKSDLVALSNMPLVQTRPRANNDQFVIDTFAMSQKMSTYLVAMIVCNFKHRQGKTRNNITYGAWARPESVDQTEFALKMGIDIIDFYEEFFMVNFPLPKQDMIAIPDFAAGAMENWGLITYRETAMLFEPGVSSESNKQRVAVVIAHELAHQWFGDLVTMSWWDDLWLNEGFAAYVEYIGTDHVHPSWKMFDMFLRDVHSAMAFDGLVTSHPIYVAVSNPDEINEIFDSISYDKGASVLRMMNHFLGENTFRYGVSNYIKSREYQNAFHDDLWASLTNQSRVNGQNLNVKNIMDTWVLQMNYPVVKVTKLPNGHLHLQQKRFLRNPDATDPLTYKSPYGYKWKIPFTYTTKLESNFMPNFTDVIWMNDEEKELVKNISPDDWVIANAQAYGYYRVNYDDENWMKIIEQLKTNHKVIHLINRAQIINDAWALASAGELKMDIALKTIDYLKDEEDYVPWSTADDELAYVSRMLKRTEIYGRFSNYMKNLVLPSFNKLGFNNSGSDHMQIYTRSLIVSLACDFGVTECITESVKLFKEWMNNPNNNPIDPNLKSTVYCTAIGERSWEEWNFAYNQYKTSSNVAEQSRLLSALSCTKETWILAKYLDLALDPNEVRTQDAVNVIIYVSYNTIGRDLAWNFVRSNWKTLMEQYGGGSFSFANIFDGIFKSFNTEFDLQQMKDFQSSHSDMGSGTRAFAQAIEKTEANIQWMTKNYDIIDNWLPKL